jgi:Uma2 family endonuclease
MPTTDETSDQLLTVEEFEALPEELYRTELVRGKVVREPPANFGHGAIAAQVGAMLHAHVRKHNLGVVVGAETGFVLAPLPSTVRAPDVAFVSHERLPKEIGKGFARFVPDLAVEVVSPSNSAREIAEKTFDYLDAGTRMVWIIDPRTRTLTVYRSSSDIRVFRETEAADVSDVVPSLTILVAELFPL